MATKAMIITLLVLIVSEVAGQCGQTPTPSDCYNNDPATCGNACCKLLFFTDSSPSDVKHRLEESLSSGGPGGLYELQQPVCRPITPGCFNETAQFVDYSAFNLSSPETGPVYYLGKATHKAPILLYNDSMYFDVGPNIRFAKSDLSWASSFVKAFSISGPGGSFGDHGQNYYQIVTLMRSLNFTRMVFYHLDDSCPEPSSNDRRMWRDVEGVSDIIESMKADQSLEFIDHYQASVQNSLMPQL